MATSPPVYGPRLPVCRLLLSDRPTDGRWNMAVDEALLDESIASDRAVVRWYAWSEATVSLGYFQSEDAITNDPLLGSLPRVRRLTGGGAIVHHHEWTYSCVVPPGQRLVRHPYDLYDLVHDTVIDWFHECYSISLQKRGVSQRGSAEPALCFLREDSRDVCFGAVKILGSAQRRRKGALLQHGSLVLKQSEFAPHIAGLCDLSPCQLSELSMADGHALVRQLALRMGDAVQPDDLTASENNRAEELSI